MKWLLIDKKTSSLNPPRGSVKPTVIEGPDFKGTYTDEVLVFIGLQSSKYNDVIPLTEEVISSVLKAAGK